MPAAGLGLTSAGVPASAVPIKSCLPVHKYNIQPSSIVEGILLFMSLVKDLLAQPFL